MSSATEKVKVRLCSFGWDRWNHRRRAMAVQPVFAVVGYAIGLLGGVHLFPASVPDGFVIALFIGATVLAGSALLALID